jgi:xylulokinase
MSGDPLGEVLPGPGALCGLAPGTPVAVCGHDHVVAAFASGAIEPGSVFNSTGTAEALVGALPHAPLGEKEFLSGLVYGPHVIPERNYWMAASRPPGFDRVAARVLGEPPFATTSYRPTWRPPLPARLEFCTSYLSGSGSPHTDLHVRAALVGLLSRTRARRPVEAVPRAPPTRSSLSAERRAGHRHCHRPTPGIRRSTRNQQWMQISRRERLPSGGACMPEATLLGAALLAGVGTGVFPLSGFPDEPVSGRN